MCHAVAYQGKSICLNTQCVPWVYSIYVWLVIPTKRFNACDFGLIIFPRAGTTRSPGGARTIEDDTVQCGGPNARRRKRRRLTRTMGGNPRTPHQSGRAAIGKTGVAMGITTAMAKNEAATGRGPGCLLRLDNSPRHLPV